MAKKQTTKPKAKVLTLRERLRADLDAEKAAYHDAIADAVTGNGSIADSEAVADAAIVLIKAGDKTLDEVDTDCADRDEVDELLARLKGGRARLAETLDAANLEVEQCRMEHKRMMAEIKREGALRLVASVSADQELGRWDRDFTALQKLMGRCPDMARRLADKMPMKEFGRPCTFECREDDSIVTHWEPAPPPEPFSPIAPPSPPRPMGEVLQVDADPATPAAIALTDEGDDLVPGKEFWGDDEEVL